MAMGKMLAAAADEEMGMEPAPPKRGGMPEDDFGPDAEHKAAFMEMCAAIREGDDEAAWAAYQECKALDGGSGGGGGY